MFNRILSLLHSIKFKVLLFLTCFIVLPSLALGILTYFNLLESDKNNASNYIINNLKSVSDNIDDILYNIEYLAIPVFSDENFLMNLKKLGGTGDNYSDYLVQKSIQEFLFNKNFQNKYINTIYLYSYLTNTAYSSTGTKRTFQQAEIQKNLWIKDYERSVSLNLKWNITESLNKEHSGGGYILSFYKPLHLFTDNKTLAIISFNVNEVHIYHLLSKIKFFNSGNIFILDQGGRVISHTNRDLLCHDVSSIAYIKKVLDSDKEAYFIDYVNGQECMISYIKSNYTGWKYVAIAPLSEVMSSASIMRNYLLFIYIFMLIMIILSIIITSYFLYRPTTKLHYYVKKVEEGIFSTLIQHNRKDEFGYIYDRFNSMVSRINTLVNDLYIQKILRKDAQIKTIQSQINEHFLYNTLDSIHWYAKQNDTENVSNIIFSLSKFFRLSLSSGKDIIPVKDVVEMINCYLNIISRRFKGKVHYEIYVDKEISESLVLKYIFQPIIENAVLHGIEKKRNGGTIKIFFNKDEDLLEFKVTDDGLGIEEIKLKQITESINYSSDQTSDNFALKNISSQIKLFYGNEYGLRITSTKGKGTTVAFKVPIVWE